jgi:hypothetical protein
MKLTLKSLRDEMKESFAESNDRIDRISLRLDEHIKDCHLRFRHIDERFDRVDERFRQVDERFDAIDRRFDAIDRRFDTFKKEIAKEIGETFSPYFMSIERMLANHEGRIDALEQKAKS